jgi:hypothetical protein
MWVEQPAHYTVNAHVIGIKKYNFLAVKVLQAFSFFWAIEGESP